MADEPQQDSEPVHPHDAIDPREFILTTPLGEDRLADLKRVMPDRAKYGEFWVPYCSAPGSYEADFAAVSNYEHFKKNFPWLHTTHSQIGLDADEIGEEFESFEQFLITISSEDWDSFIADVESVENYPDIDDQRSSELRMEAEREYWEQWGFEGWLKEAKKKFIEDSFQHWVLDSLAPWDAYELCTDVGEYMEEEGGGNIFFRAEKAVDKIAWTAVEAEVDEPALRQSYEAAKEAYWKGDGGTAFLAACHRHSINDTQFASGLAALTEDRLKRIYDRIVIDENIGDPDLPAYVTVAAEAEVVAAEGREARPAVPPYLVVSTRQKEGYEDEAAEYAVVLARDLIAKGTEPMEPLEHPELPFQAESRKPLGRQTAAADKWIPKGFKIDKEFGCLTAAETLAKMVPKLRYVEGFARGRGERQWGSHAWCVAPDGTIVDPYFRWRFPKEWTRIEYKEGPNAFDHIHEAVDPKDFINQNPRSKIGDTVEGTCPKCGTKKLLGRNWPDFVEHEGYASACTQCGTPMPYLNFVLVHSVPESLDPKDFILRTPSAKGTLERRRSALQRLEWTSGNHTNWVDTGYAEPTADIPFWEFWFNLNPWNGANPDDPHIVKRANEVMQLICNQYFDLDWQQVLERVPSNDHDFVFRIRDPFLFEAASIPDPYDPDKLSQSDVRNWIVSGGPDVGQLLWNTDKLYLIIPGDQHTLDKYMPGKTLTDYSMTIVGVPDPNQKYKSSEEPFILNEQYGEVQIRYGGSSYQHELEGALNNKLYGAELRQALIQRYRNMARETGLQDEDAFKNAVLMLYQVGGHESMKGFYKRIRPGQIYKFDIKYGMALLKRGRIAAAAKRFGVDRRQITKDGFLYGVADWSDTTDFFYHGNREDYRGTAKKVFDGEMYDWFDFVEGSINEAIDMLLPAHYQKIRELLLWSEVRNPILDGEPFFNTLDERGEPAGEVVLNKEIMASLGDDDIASMLKNTDEFDYDNQLEEIANALKHAHARSQETAMNDAYYKEYTDALESALGKSSWIKVGGKERLFFLIPWPDMLERLNKAVEDQGSDYDGTLGDLVASYSEPAKPSDDPSPDYKDIKKFYQEDDALDMLHEIKPNPGPPPQPEDPNQINLPLAESGQMLLEGYDYGCTMVHLPENQAQFLLGWGKLNIPDDLLHNPPDDDTMGREDEMHATVKYGLQTTGIPDALRKLVTETAAFPVYIGAVSLFRQDDHDVVKLGVESPWLTALHNKIGEVIPCPGDKWPDYQPHITIAYVKSGSCDHLVGQDPFEAEDSPGAEFVAYEVEYTGPGELDGERVREMLPLNKTDWRSKEMKEAIEPKDFIQRNAPTKFVITAKIGQEERNYYMSGGGFSPDKHWALEMTEPNAERVLKALKRTTRDFALDLKIEPVFEAVEPKDFILGQPARYIIGDPANNCWIGKLGETFCWSCGGHSKEQAFVWSNRERAERHAQKLNRKPRFGLFARVVPLVSESVDPKQFINVNAPEHYVVIRRYGRKFYFHNNGDWRQVPSQATGMPAAEAEAMANQLRHEIVLEPNEVAEVFSEPIEESLEAKDFIMANAPLGYHVKITKPLDDLFGGRPKNRPYYFQAMGRMSHAPGEALPLEQATQMVDYLKHRYGPSVFNYIEIVPVYETAPTIRNAFSGPSQRDGPVQAPC